MTSKDLKNLLVTKLNEKLTNVLVETELKTLMSSPEEKIIVSYSNADYKTSDRVGLLSRIRTPIFTINILVRDPLEIDNGLDYLDQVRDATLGLKYGEADHERFFPLTDRFEEFLPETNLYAFKLDVGTEQHITTIEENL